MMHLQGIQPDSQVARHFVHYSKTDCEGESDLHRKLKSVATSHLEHVFGDRAEWCDVEHRLTSPTESADYRQADALVHFRERDEQLGNGLIIEVQYRNEDKNIEETTEDYLAQGYAVAWVEPDDFNEANNECLLDESALRQRARSAALHLRDSHWKRLKEFMRGRRTRVFNSSWRGCRAWANEYGHGKTERAQNMIREGIEETGGTTSNVPARLPREFYDREALKIWNATRWDTIMNVRGRSPQYDEMFQDIKGSASPHGVESVRLPREYLEQLAIELWRATPWEALVSDERAGHSLDDLPALADISESEEPEEPRVPVSFPFEWVEHELQAIHHRAGLLKRFDNAGPSPDEVRVPQHPRSITRARIADEKVCREDEHRWRTLNGRYWRECTECGLADVTLADLGQNVETPYVSEDDRRAFNGVTETIV